MTGNGSGSSMPAASRNIVRTSASISARISSSSRNEVSMSICVNSGCRSGAQVLVAEALHDLVVAVEARRPSASA
jgi:hypothetical protein